jgi:ABC-2 type transport system ATP-binding protein
MSIKVRNITKLFGKQKALNDVSFEVPSSQVVGFLGPNGAGKSTMMKVITGFIKPTSGAVLVNGLSIENPRTDFRKFIGYLPENNPLYSDMFVKEYLSFVAKIYGLGRIGTRRVHELIDLTGIGYEQNKKIGQLSRGYRQRVGLAQALLNRPSVLILDEPTSGLDPNQIVEIRRIIADVGKEKTVLLSTHIMQEVEAICSRVIIINKGNIVANDTTANVMSNQNFGRQEVFVELTEKADPNIFKQINGVHSVITSGDGANAFTILYGGTDDVRPTIFSKCVENGLTIVTLKQKSMQMEEVFQLLTQTEPSL